MSRFLPALTSFILALSVLAAPMGAQAEVMHRLAIQISDDDPQKMNTVLNVASNVTRHYTSLGEEVDVQVVAFNRGLHMLRSDTSAVSERIQNFAKSMPYVNFQACGVTMKGMTKKEGKRPELFAFADEVPAGVVRLMELDGKGYTIIRP